MYEDIRFSAENAVILWTLEQYDKRMKKWQKISGRIIFGLGAVIELLFVSNALLDLKYIVEPCDNEDIIERMYLNIDVLSCAMWINYFVALDSFSQVLIDDTKHDKFDNCEINTGSIISIRATIGLAHHIVKLSDERLIVFEVLPKGYGELYENFTIIAPSDNKYSGYLEDYEQGKEFDF